MSGRPLSIVLLARSLDVGGTERQLVELAKGLRGRGHNVRVALFYGGGVLARELDSIGIEILELGKSGRWDLFAFLTRTVAALRRAHPDVIYSFLGGANVVAALVKPFLPESTLIWSIRNSSRDPSIDNFAARLGHRAEAALARVPDKIIANSVAGRAFSIGRGFPADRIVVVPNGIDTDRFRANPASRSDQRRKLGLGDSDILVGVLGRLNSTKDYPTFLRAAAAVAGTNANARFACVGGGPELPRLQQLAKELGIADRVFFAGEMDSADALNSFDVACSPSVTEGFSNAIAEAMSCGLPCVVTDAGDSAAIVGTMGSVVPVSSPGELALAIESQIESLPSHNPAAARTSIVGRFSIDAMLDRTLDVFREVLCSRNGNVRGRGQPAG